MSHTLAREGVLLRVEATPDGRTRCPVQVFTREPEAVLLPLDEYNLMKAEERGRLAAALPEPYQAEAEALAAQLANDLLQAHSAPTPPAGSGDTDSLFDEPEPWPEPVAGATLLADVEALFARFVVLPEGAATALVGGPSWPVCTHET